MSLVENSFTQQPQAGGDTERKTNVTVALEETGSEDENRQENLDNNDVVSYIKGIFHKAEQRRQFDERRWLTAYINYRGIYSDRVKFHAKEKSQAFIKITKTKVLAAVAQISDVMFSGSRFPVEIRATPNQWVPKRPCTTTPKIPEPILVVVRRLILELQRLGLSGQLSPAPVSLKALVYWKKLLNRSKTN